MHRINCTEYTYDLEQTALKSRLTLKAKTLLYI